MKRPIQFAAAVSLFALGASPALALQIYVSNEKDKFTQPPKNGREHLAIQLPGLPLLFPAFRHRLQFQQVHCLGLPEMRY